MKSTIKDVARLANVSITTVSRVLNTPELVARDTLTEVLKVIEELQYHPNALARGLINKRTQTVAVLIPDLSNLFFTELVRGIEDKANESGYNVIICNTHNSKDRMMAYLRILNEKQVDGIIFTSEPIYPDYYEIFRALPMPVVLAATHSLEYELASVKVNDEKAGFDAGEYLIQLGHRNIGMLGGSVLDQVTALPRLQGFIRAMRTHGVDFDLERCVVHGGYRFEHGYSGMISLHNKFPELTAVFASSDERAMGAITYLHEQGIRIPEDISVIGFDNTRLAEMCYPKLTTVAQPLHSIGYEAASKLDQLLNNGAIEELRTYVPHEIIVRESTRNIM